MKKLLLISSLEQNAGATSSSGVGKKILLEIATFKQIGFEVHYVVKDNDIYWLDIGTINKIKLCHAEIFWYKSFNRICQRLLSLSDSMTYDVLYLRLENASVSLWKLLKHLRTINPSIKLVAEVPTVSRKWEPGTPFIRKVKYIVKELQRRIYLKKLDLMATFDNSKSLYGIPTITIENFVDVEAIPVRNDSVNPNQFHILAIALMTEAHGFDRIIAGMSNYYKSDNFTREVYLTIIGEGPAKSRLQRLTQQLGLTKYVSFVGLKNTSEISDYVNKADVASGSLAIFRKKCYKASELKIREYCSRAIPFFYSAEEPILKGKSWCLKVAHDESPIDIKQVITFIDSLDKAKCKIEMRNFALKSCTCQPQLQKVIDQLEL